MALVNVLSEIVIALPREEVAAFAGNPGNAPVWYKNIKSVEWKTTPPAVVGSQIAFVALYLGIVTVAQDWHHAIRQLAIDRWWVGAIVVGFGVQVGLFVFLR